MVHGEHVHLILSDPVNDSVAMETDFANGLVLNLWDDSAQLGVRGKVIRGPERTICENGGYLGCIPRDKQADCLQVIQGLKCPPLLQPLCHTSASFGLAHELA